MSSSLGKNFKMGRRSFRSPSPALPRVLALPPPPKASFCKPSAAHAQKPVSFPFLPAASPLPPLPSTRTHTKTRSVGGLRSQRGGPPSLAVAQADSFQPVASSPPASLEFHVDRGPDC